MPLEKVLLDYFEICKDTWPINNKMQLNLDLWKAGTKNLSETLVHLNNKLRF